MKKRALHPLVFLVALALVLSLSLSGALSAQALTITQGGSFGIPVSFSSETPITSLFLQFNTFEGLTLVSASGSMTWGGGGNFTTDVLINSGTVTLTFKASADAAPEQAVMIEGIIGSDGINSWSVGSGFRTDIAVNPAAAEETWPDGWTLVTPATHDLPRRGNPNLQPGQHQKARNPCTGARLG